MGYSLANQDSESTEDDVEIKTFPKRHVAVRFLGFVFSVLPEDGLEQRDK